jgi:hypothetical protein
MYVHVVLWRNTSPDICTSTIDRPGRLCVNLMSPNTFLPAEVELTAAWMYLEHIASAAVFDVRTIVTWNNYHQGLRSLLPRHFILPEFTYLVCCLFLNLVKMFVVRIDHAVKYFNVCWQDGFEHSARDSHYPFRQDKTVPIDHTTE